MRKMFKKVTMGAVTVAMASGAMLAGAGSANATNQVACWPDRTDLVWITIRGNTTCWANAGVVAAGPWSNWYQSIDKISTGNNRVQLDFQTNSGAISSIWLDKYNTRTFVPESAWFRQFRVY